MKKRFRGLRGENYTGLHFFSYWGMFALLRQEGHRHLFYFKPFFGRGFLNPPWSVPVCWRGKIRLCKCPCPTFLITNSLKDVEVLCTQSSKQNKGVKKFERKQNKYRNCLLFKLFLSHRLQQQPNKIEQLKIASSWLCIQQHSVHKTIIQEKVPMQIDTTLFSR